MAKLIKETENKLKKWNESLKLPDFTKDDEWKSMRFDAAIEIQMIKNEMEIYMNDLLANKDYQFSPIDIKDDNNFGEFYVKKIVETGKINMVLNNFSSIKSDSLTYNDSNETVINDVPWIISTCLELIKDVEYLAFFVEPKCGDDVLKKNTKRNKRFIFFCALFKMKEETDILLRTTKKGTDSESKSSLN